MPALSPTMTEGKLAKWHVKEGDTVSSGDVIAEIETDKATMEVEAVDEGVVGKLMVEEGTDNVAVNVKDVPAFSKIELADVDNVTVGAFSFSVIVNVSDCVPSSAASAPDTLLIATIAVSFPS